MDGTLREEGEYHPIGPKWEEIGPNVYSAARIKGGEPHFAAIPGQWEENTGISVFASDLRAVSDPLIEAVNIPACLARQVAVIRTECLQFFHLAAI